MKPSVSGVKKQRAAYTEWLERTWRYSRGWTNEFRNMVFWYSIAGTAVLSGGAADSMLADAQGGKRIIERRRQTWVEARKLAIDICENEGSNPVDWFTGRGGCLYLTWQSLIDIHQVGPKIASWIMRDLSMMRDYTDGRGKIQPTYRSKIDRSWYDELPVECQAFFVPIDVWVHAGAKACGIGKMFRKYSSNRMQVNQDLHLEGATQIVNWSRKNGYDPRDLNIYWYLIGSGKSV